MQARCSENALPLRAEGDPASRTIHSLTFGEWRMFFKLALVVATKCEPKRSQKPFSPKLKMNARGVPDYRAAGCETDHRRLQAKVPEGN
jgi:hypothetical protein